MGAPRRAMQLIIFQLLFRFGACREHEDIEFVVLRRYNFDQLVKNGTKWPWFIAFMHQGCDHCVLPFHHFKRLSVEMRQHMRFGLVDASEGFWYWADRWDLTFYPQFKLLFDNRAYTMKGNMTFYPMLYFLAHPEKRGWELYPAEAIPLEPTLCERLEIKMNRWLNLTFTHGQPPGFLLIIPIAGIYCLGMMMWNACATCCRRRRRIAQCNKEKCS